MKPAGATTGFDETFDRGVIGREWPSVRLGVLREAWQLYRSDWKTWSLTMLIAVVVPALVEKMTTGGFTVFRHGLFLGVDASARPDHRFLAWILRAALNGVFTAGMIRMALARLEGRRPRVEDVFAISESWFDVVLASVLIGAILFLGWSFFVIPGMIAAGLLMFTYPLIVDAHLPATGAMIQSFEVLKGQWLLAAIVHLVIAFVAAIGAAFLGIGLLVTGPLYALSIAILYREVFRASHAAYNTDKFGRFDDVI